MDPTTPADNSTPQVTPAPHRSARNAILLLSAIGAATLVVIGIFVWTLIPSTEESAVAACHEEVADRLKDPDSAIFEEDFLVEQDDDGESWVIAGEARATNSFGAMTTLFYVCTVEPEGDGWAIEAEAIE